MDPSVTPEELYAVEQLVQRELAQLAPLGPHPQAGLLPLSTASPRPLLLLDIERLEQEDEERAGISMDRYTQFGDDPRRMYTAVSYAVLRERNAALHAQNAADVVRAQQAYVELLAQLDLAYQQQLRRKRSRADELTEERKRRQGDFEPVAGYLEELWQEGIRNMVDMGLEAKIA